MFAGRPRLTAWRDRVKKEVTEKLFDEAHHSIMNVSSLPQKMKDNIGLEHLKLKFHKLFR